MFERKCPGSTRLNSLTLSYEGKNRQHLNGMIEILLQNQLEFVRIQRMEPALEDLFMEVTALSSWSQFYKNMPLCTIVFVLLFSTILTAEYQKGTLVNLLTKGMKRWKVLISKTFALAAFWTFGYWLCYGSTYGYNAYFWDNGTVCHAGFSAFCFYLLGLWSLSLVMILSTLMPSGPLVLLGLFGGFCITWFARLLPYVKEWTPARLLSASQLLTGDGSPGDYGACIFLTCVLMLFHIGAAILRFNKKAIWEKRISCLKGLQYQV